MKRSGEGKENGADTVWMIEGDAERVLRMVKTK